jgi:mono/diheme cytochrome c family protein
VRKQLLILGTSLLLGACATDRNASDLSQSAAKGRAFAEANCAGCHALDDGVSPDPDAPSLRRAANRLPAWAVAGSFERGVQVGHSMQMPEFVFAKDDVANLLAYFEALKAQD